ncbi:hypothetical protein L210DRAFT_236834 [Boletus edulis BED1]|uniref:Fungal lipase-type domain-containing protein n=1 Tax=Boletus edulis BED1 TaxID=1328754 RepID=A0AAD4GDQ6_BOLED|nr:hypothetical protein L210DRAFT_236834 [Boletus edulis BED1]
MKEYTKYTNIKFVPSKDRSSASIRITFFPKAKHWVSIGTDALMIDPEKATMNLAWIDPDELSATNSVIALHAIGHVLGLVHENFNPPMSNFPEYDKDSIMRYSDTTTVKRGVVPQLSSRDKAWLTLNYPRAPTNKEIGTENTDTLEHVLEVLKVDGDSSSKILETSDISERRFLYSQFMSRNARGVEKATDQNTLGELTRKLPDYPDVLLKLQSQLGSKAVPGRDLPGAPPRPADIKKYILDFLHILRSSGGSSSPTGTQSERFNEIIPALLQFMEMIGSGDPSEGPVEGPITQEELDDLQRQLSAMLDSSPNNEPISVEHGILTELPGIRNILDWFSRTVSESRTDVRKIPSSVANKMLDMLRKSPPQNVFQEVYHLCFASYYVHDVNGTQKDLQMKHQQLLESILPQIGSHAETGATATVPSNRWELVWGPVIWKVKPKDDSGGPDLAWYIAYNGSFVCGDDDEPKPTYVIAIAGTQSRSVHTWINSNFDVTFPVDFKSWVSSLRSDPYHAQLPKADVKWGSPYIARGTARTVWQLLTVAAPPGAKAEGQPLLDFLKSKSKSNPDLRVITTGHSLGGTLCPTLAIVLVEVDVVLRDRILTYPIAGPSPGNDAFAKHFAETLQPIPANRDDLKTRNYQVWNLNIVNAYDPVPQAWCSDEQACPKQNLLNIKNIIPGSYIKSVFSAIISNVLSDLLGANLRYMSLQSQIFSPRPSESFKEVRPQHTEAYHEYVGINPPHLLDTLS